MKRAVIFINGDLSDITQAKNHIKPTDLIICADGGAKFAIKLGLQPDVMIGDFDSIDKDLQNKLKTNKATTWLTYPTDKDWTDSELAANYALEKGYKNILIFGALGSRLDHLLTNVFYLSNLKEKGVDAMIVEGKQEVRVVTDALQLKGNIGDLVSLIPLKGDVHHLVVKGTQYEGTQQNIDMLFGYSFGLCDVLTKKTAQISLKGGTLLVIHKSV